MGDSAAARRHPDRTSKVFGPDANAGSCFGCVARPPVPARHCFARQSPPAGPIAGRYAACSSARVVMGRRLAERSRPVRPEAIPAETMMDAHPPASPGARVEPVAIHFPPGPDPGRRPEARLRQVEACPTQGCLFIAFHSAKLPEFAARPVSSRPNRLAPETHSLASLEPAGGAQPRRTNRPDQPSPGSARGLEPGPPPPHGGDGQRPKVFVCRPADGSARRSVRPRFQLPSPARISTGGRDRWCATISMQSAWTRVVGTERSAAWLAHQSGGLGVGSSNLPAPTNEIKGLCRI